MNQFLLFAFTAFMLNITPGNDMLFVMSRSLSYGLKAGIFAALGIGLGCFVHTFAAVAGLSVIISQSEFLFNLIKYAGAGYLIFIGVKSFLDKPSPMLISSENASNFTNKNYLKTLWQGTVTNVLNPKVSLFFLAFLPQFIDNQAENISIQILLMGLWFNFSGTLVNILIAFLFGKIISKMSQFRRFWQWQSKVSGVILVALGISVALKR